MSLGVCFHPVDEEKITGRFRANPILQGYSGVLHGGVVAALLDAAMTHCLFHRGEEGVTADLHVRFVEPIPCDGAIDIRAHVVSSKGPLFVLKGELLHEGRVKAWGEAKFIRRPSAVSRD